jgi:dihydropteroate synthase
VLDPGLGLRQDRRAQLGAGALAAALRELGRPLLVGASRKGFLGALLADASGSPRPARERDAATAAVTVLAAQAGRVGGPGPRGARQRGRGAGGGPRRAPRRREAEVGSDA